MNMKLNEDIKRIKNIIESSDKLNESETIGNRTWFDDDEHDAFERVMNRMLSKKYPWWKKMDISHMVYDTKEKKLTFSGDLTLKQEWVDSLDYDLEIEDGEVTWLGDFLSPEDGYKIREDFAESFSFVFGLPTDSVRYNVEVLIDEPQDITEEIENTEPRKDLSKFIRKLVQPFIDSNPGVVCDIRVLAPWKRKTIHYDQVYKDYQVLVTFVGGPESDRWPTTMAVRDKNEKIMNDIWDRIHAVFSLPVDVYSTNVSKCKGDDKVIGSDSVSVVENELPKKSKIDLVRELVKRSGFKTASDVLGGTANLVNILFDGDIMNYYEETGFKPIRITDDGMNMYIDDLIISSFGLEPKGSGVFGKEIYLGDFSWKSGGMNYKVNISITPIVNSNTGQKSWRVVGTSGDSGFGYGFINKRNIIGKRGRTQIFKQIIDKYNLSEFL